MAGRSAVRQLVALCRSSDSLSQAVLPAAGAASCSWSLHRQFASDAPSRKDVVNLLGNQEDPEVAAALQAYLKQAYAAAGQAGAATAAPPAAESGLEFTAKVERKYVAAQIVEYGLQNVAVPLAASSSTPLKRYAAQLAALGAKAGFQEPTVEIERKLSEAASVVESVKEFLAKVKPYSSPEFHASLLDALQEVENELGASVTFDGTSPGYKKFAEKVKALAQAHKLPWQLLLSYKAKVGSVDEATADGLKKDYAAWLQAAQVGDAKAEVDDLRAEATRLLDLHLSKSAQEVKKEDETTLAQTLRKLEAAKGSTWATKFQADLQFTKWFDSAVAANPGKGPTA